MEAELFGYEQGAFTGARDQRQGLFELSDEGTIFLDEIGDMPLKLQAKLLSVLEDKKIRRIGGSKSISLDLRIIAATNVNLLEKVKQNEFRHDLYYRLNVLPITLPPLRKRKLDIPILSFFFLQQLNKQYHKDKRLEPAIIDYFLNYHWPGNVRELKNIIERIYHMSESNEIKIEDLPEIIRTKEGFQTYLNDISFSTQASSDYYRSVNPFLNQTIPLSTFVKQIEKNYIAQTIRKHPTLQEAAKALQISLSTLARKRREYKLL